MKEDEITVFIVEDEALAKELTEKYFGKGITYAALFKQHEREKVARLLELISE